MTQSDALRYVVAAAMATIFLGSCVMVAVAASLEDRRKKK